jgi:hypothetical protein
MERAVEEELNNRRRDLQKEIDNRRRDNYMRVYNTLRRGGVLSNKSALERIELFMDEIEKQKSVFDPSNFFDPQTIKQVLQNLPICRAPIGHSEKSLELDYLAEKQINYTLAQKKRRKVII